jgi:hypothetical protein
MKVTFQIQENIEQLIINLTERFSHGGGIGEGGSVFFKFWEEAFPYTTVEVEGKINPGINTWMDLTTAWSGFKYEFQERDGKTLVTYEGAYRGLLAQDILPFMTLTPNQDLLAQEVDSSMGSMSLREYAIAQAGLWRFKKDNNLRVNRYPHPQIIQNRLEEPFNPTPPSIEEQMIGLYDEAVEEGNFTFGNENYQVNTLYIWPNGRWEERCDNGYGSSLGG